MIRKNGYKNGLKQIWVSLIEYFYNCVKLDRGRLHCSGSIILQNNVFDVGVAISPDKEHIKIIYEVINLYLKIVCYKMFIKATVEVMLVIRFFVCRSTSKLNTESITIFRVDILNRRKCFK